MKEAYLLPFTTVSDLKDAIDVLTKASEAKREKIKSEFELAGCPDAVSFVVFQEGKEPIMGVDRLKLTEGVDVDKLMMSGDYLLKDAKDSLGVIDNTAV